MSAKKQIKNQSRTRSFGIGRVGKSIQAKANARLKLNRIADNHSLFWPFLFMVLFLWILYRSLFHFPVWFDETIGKAVFFGLPVWLYLTASGTIEIANTFALEKFQRGMWLGVAIGGIYGFVATIVSLLKNSSQVLVNEPLYLADYFWGEFLLAIFTGFWETLFFYSFVFVVILEKHWQWSTIKKLLVVSLIFVIFHLSNVLLRFDGLTVVWQATILTLFAVGQGFLFLGERNSFALVLSQAIWGMVLLARF